MSAQELLAELAAAGVRLTLTGAGIHYQTKPGVGIASFVERIREHKPALLWLLPIEPTKPPAGWDGSLCPGCRWPALCAVVGPRAPYMVHGPCAAWPQDERGEDATRANLSALRTAVCGDER